MSVVLDTTKYRWFLTIPKKKRLQFHKKKKAPETCHRHIKRPIKRPVKRLTRHCCCGRQLLF
jgi:hypothetical protein